MKTEELEEYMRNDAYISSFQWGVVAQDEIPHEIHEPAVFIVNTDPSTKPGTHWLTLFFNFNCAEQFDSSGQKPILNIQHELVTHSQCYMYNNVRVQSYFSDTCGQFSLFFAYFRCRGYSFREIMNMFSRNLEMNENLVNFFYSLTK